MLTRLTQALTLFVALAVFQFAAAQTATGTLVVDIQEFTSEIDLKPKILTQLRSGGVEWGYKDNLVVVTAVNKRFINFDIPYLTRFGGKQEVTLPAGDYQITCVGLIPKTAFSAEKILAKGGYFNESVLSFRVEEGKITTLKVTPIIRKQNTAFLKIFQAELMAEVVTEVGTTEPVSLNAHTEQSIAWPKYKGNLKF